MENVHLQMEMQSLSVIPHALLWSGLFSSCFRSKVYITDYVPLRTVMKLATQEKRNIVTLSKLPLLRLNSFSTWYVYLQMIV